MFGIIVAGRLVQADPQQVSENQFLFNIDQADGINHLVVFMTGSVPFPDGLGGAVYFSWPSTSGHAWTHLGFISNEKPSAVFKVGNLPKDSAAHPSPFGGFAMPSAGSMVAQVGISVEPLVNIVQQSPAANTAASTKDTFNDFATKMLESLYNFVQSFSQKQDQMVPQPTEVFIPGSKLTLWYENFGRRLEQNPYFWRS